MHFADFRAWSVHAFKTHARVDEVRRLADGSQCPTCLRHYPTPIQLGRHLKHSRPCRQPLLSRGFWSAPEPGQGNRKAIDKGLICAPALQAEGPAGPQIDIFVEDEVRRPSAEVLDCLALVGYDVSPSSLPEAVLWERIRLAFSCVCLPLSRLRATAETWQGSLLQCASQVLPDADRQVLSKAAEWVCNTEFAQWLVPTPRGQKVQPHTPLRIVPPRWRSFLSARLFSRLLNRGLLTTFCFALVTLPRNGPLLYALIAGFVIRTGTPSRGLPQASRLTSWMKRRRNVGHASPCSDCLSACRIVGPNLLGIFPEISGGSNSPATWFD